MPRERLTLILRRFLKSVITDIHCKPGKSLADKPRSSCNISRHQGMRTVTKRFSDDENGHLAFNQELLFTETFDGFDWCPRVLDAGDRSITYEYLPQRSRLDIAAGCYNAWRRYRVASQLADALLDIHAMGFAHRDVHGKNIFASRKQIKIVDFEASVKLDGDPFPFSQAYDLTGKGLPSPSKTNHMCWSSDARVSAKNLLGINSETVLDILRDRLLEQLRFASSSFNTNLKRHKLSSQKIYGSFDIPGLSVPTAIAQRNTRMRAAKFGITARQITGRTILDLGSNVGAMLFDLQKHKPRHSLGVEIDDEKVRACTRVAAFCGVPEIKFMQRDIDEISPEDVQGGADVVLCLAIERHVRSPERLFSLLGKCTKQTLYFEGNEGTDEKVVVDKLKQNGFARIESLGFCDDDCNPKNNCRAIFVAHKE
jgi:2-polyprenyl-3-methyl-5-hydroxy-6-metoxy-1,4-benzoquinol methylase/predicted Ser/Thr protein kinase